MYVHIDTLFIKYKRSLSEKMKDLFLLRRPKEVGEGGHSLPLVFLGSVS